VDGTGLHQIEAQPDGGLKRARTLAADAYKDVIAKGPPLKEAAAVQTDRRYRHEKAH
jgi:hypothetical protein